MNVICRICGEPLGSGAVSCNKCQTPHHQDCWAFYGQCSVYACGSRRHRPYEPSLEEPAIMTIDESTPVINLQPGLLERLFTVDFIGMSYVEGVRGWEYMKRSFGWLVACLGALLLNQVLAQGSLLSNATIGTTVLLGFLAYLYFIPVPFFWGLGSIYGLLGLAFGLADGDLRRDDLRGPIICLVPPTFVLGGLAASLDLMATVASIGLRVLAVAFIVACVAKKVANRRRERDDA